MSDKHKNTVKVAELFAGVGGFRLGLDGYDSPDDPSMSMPPAGPFETVWANQWEPGNERKQFAARCYKKRFDDGTLVNDDISKVLDSAEAGNITIPDVDMVVGGFPCFVAGTRVLTTDGYKPIEDITEHDSVITHNGNVKPVTMVGHTDNADLVSVSIDGVPEIVCTPNHPFFVRTRSSGTYGDVHIKRAADLTSDDCVLMASHEMNVTQRNEYDLTEDECYVLGRYMADECSVQTYKYKSVRTWRTGSSYIADSIGNMSEDEKKRMVSNLANRMTQRRVPVPRHSETMSIAVEKDDVAYEMLLSHAKPIDDKACDSGSINDKRSTIFCSSRKLTSIIAEHHVGYSNMYDASHKHVPFFIMTLPRDLRQAFIDGYLNGCNTLIDGYQLQSNQFATTSIDLALSMSLLIEMTTDKYVNISTVTIDQHRVNCFDVAAHDLYVCSIYNTDRNNVTPPVIQIDGRTYRHVSSSTPLTHKGIVYNLEVEDDHSYVANNACVHNCQSYSVARPSNKSFGLDDQDKGVLWWQICRFIELKHPTYCLFENVDRLLKSPSKQRGRDFAVILSCLNRYGYLVEWHVINAADYGMPQKRRRVYIFARKRTGTDASIDMEKYLLHDGVLAHAFPVKPEPPKKSANSKAAVNQNDGVNDDDSTSIADKCMSYRTFDISDDTYAVSESFGIGDKASRFENAGVMIDGHVLTIRCVADYDGKHETLGDVLVDSNDVPENYYVDDDAVERWRWFKSSKSFPRVSADGHEYTYSEGAMAFPDDLSKPARTILTGEGGKSASRMKHIIIDDTGRYRRLVPEELESIQMFPKGWTDGVGMTDNQRAFCMGNALLTGIPHRIGKAMCEVLNIG